MNKDEAKALRPGDWIINTYPGADLIHGRISRLSLQGNTRGVEIWWKEGGWYGFRALDSLVFCIKSDKGFA